MNINNVNSFSFKGIAAIHMNSNANHNKLYLQGIDDDVFLSAPDIDLRMANRTSMTEFQRKDVEKFISKLNIDSLNLGKFSQYLNFNSGIFINTENATISLFKDK